MKLLNIGGATAVLQHKGKRFLFDPWIIDGIFHGSWYHFPPSRVGIKDVGHLDYIYISHIHEDHCAPTTIQHLNRDAEVVLLDRTPNFVRSFLSQHEFDFKKLHLVRERTPIWVEPGFRVDMLPGDPAHELSHIIDSIMIIQWDGLTIVNANDCQLYPAAIEYINKVYPHIDLALLPYSGGSGYPACYVNLTHEEKVAERNRIVQMRARSFVDAVKALKPKRAMPFADQYVVAGSRSHLNKFISHSPATPNLLRSYMREAGIEDKFLVLNSGQQLDVETSRVIPDEPYRGWTEEDQEAYIAENLRDKKYDHELIALDARVSIDRLLQAARARLWAEQERRGLFGPLSFYLDVPDRKVRYHVALDRPTVETQPIHAELKEPFLRVSANSSLMVFLLIGHVSWNIADAALFLDYERRPNQYNPSAYVLLNLLKV